MDQTMPPPDMALAQRLFTTLANRTGDGIGVTRDSYGAGEQRAHELCAQAAEEIGLEVEFDFAGNLYMVLPGSDRAAPRTLIGSHLDSVPCGGNYDGAAGVVCGLAVLSGLNGAGVVPERDIAVMGIRAEETPWFPYSFIGSRAALGSLPPEVVDGVRRSDSGKTVAEHMSELGFDPEPVRQGQAHLTPQNTERFFEVHIEQGPVLVGEELPVAVVTGIQGSTRWRQARIFGRYGHSGGVPRGFRSDAVAAFVDLAAAVNAKWDELSDAGHQAVVTFCTVNTDPRQASMNRIAGEVRFALDIRSLEPDVLAIMDETIERAVREIELRRQVHFELGPHTGTTLSACDPALIASLRASAEALDIPHKLMPSGGGHDTQAFIEAGIPGAMLFVRNPNDSHNPQEAMAIADLEAAAKVLMRSLLTRAKGDRAPAEGASGPVRGREVV